jgi:hypothetical protein
MTTKIEFINKWKCWWMLQKQGAELTDAFERELNAIIEQEVVSKNLVKADVSGSLGFDEGYSKGYSDAQREASQEIREHYHPNDR